MCIRDRNKVPSKIIIQVHPFFKERLTNRLDETCQYEFQVRGDKKEFIIGSDENCDIVTVTRNVAPQHCKIVFEEGFAGGAWYIVDLSQQYQTEKEIYGTHFCLSNKEYEQITEDYEEEKDNKEIESYKKDIEELSEEKSKLESQYNVKYIEETKDGKPEKNGEAQNDKSNQYKEKKRVSVTGGLDQPKHPETFTDKIEKNSEIPPEIIKQLQFIEDSIKKFKGKIQEVQDLSLIHI
eukprot:TRINITY_DN12416_c0_g1_i1.p3 TRINITY_DN12416_c0_g1~~TRINITY_DN12416_c0_g1_i1.p3  ORF type:complete len:237 (+),score=56.14 TRINITY_DN12416_c0_g1_i1:64-774(+)